MNLKNFLKTLLTLVLFTVLVSSATFAQTNWYVNNTNGNDIAYDGKTAATPYKTINQAVSSAADGDVVNIAADTYPEAAVAVGKNLTFVVYNFSGSSTATVVNGMAFSGTGTSNLGVTGGVFNLGTTATALTLTAGTLNIATANVVLGSGATITRTAGAISAAPTFGANTNLVYNGAVDIVSGPELPADLGTGTLTGSLTAAKAVTISAALSTNGITTNANTTFNFQGNVTLTGDINNTGKLQLNSSVLTWSPSANLAVTKLGTVVSTTAGTVGNALVQITGSKTITTDAAAGELPNFTVPSGYTGAFTLGANLTVAGNFTMSSATVGAFAFGANTLSVLGNFNRTDNTLNNVNPGTGTLSFTGTGAQTFATGSSLSLNNVSVNKASGTVTMGSSIVVAGNFDITSGSLELGDYNINMNGNGTFTNGGQFYSTTGNGYVVFNSPDVGGVGVTANAATITGSGTFGNILVNLTDPADLVATGSSVNLSGVLFLNQGKLDIANAAHTLTFTNTLVTNPTIKISTNNTAGISNTGGGTITYSANVNLYYLGNNSYTVGTEWTAAVASKINNLTIAVASGKIVTGLNAASTINGVLTVNSGTTLAQGANVYTLAGANMTHTIAGTVSGGTLTVTGDASTINGSTVTGDVAAVNNLTINIGTGTTFTSNNLKTIAGNLSVTGGTSNITMEGTTSVITGNVTNVSGTLSLSLPGATTNTHGGNLVVTDGNVTYTRTSANNTIGGTLTLTAGNLTLGSNVAVTGQTTVAAGNLALGSFNLTQLGSIATPDFNRTGAGAVTGTGTVVFDATAGAIDVTPGATFSVPNVETKGANGVTINAAMTVSNSFLHTSGALALTGALTVSGDTFTEKAGAGAITGEIDFTGTAATATFEQDAAIPTLKINTTGAVTFASNNTTARTITVGTAFTLTAGTFNLGINNLVVNGTFTYTAGSITQDTGVLTWNTAAPSLAAGFIIDNLKVAGAANVGTAAFAVNKYLTLNNTLTTNADGKLTLGAGATIERTANAATLSNLPTFGATTNLVYSTAGPITAAKEQPATVNNYTIKDGITVVLAADVTVSGILTINGTLTQGARTVTMADGSTLDLQIVGTTATDKDLTKDGTMNLIYEGTFATSTRELGPTTNATTHTAGNVTFKSGTITLDASATFTGSVTFSGGALDLNAKSLYVQSDVVQTNAAGFFAATGASNLYLSGATNTAFTLKAANFAVPATLSIILSKTNANNTAALTGGNLDFATTPVNLNLSKGVFETDGTSSIILKQSNAGGQPTQGFARTSGVIAGNVKKFIDKTDLVGISYVIFPTGDTTGNYRPITYFFKTAPQSSINLTVNYSSANPGGSNGFPIAAGSLQLTNYPPFFWYVKSDIPLAPSYQYDMEAQAQGYTDYITDQIQNVRFVRRDSGSVNNQWILQGGGSYDNSTIATDWPVVKVVDATGGVSTQGSIFAYSQLNKAPNFTAALGNVTKNEGDTLTFTYTATDPDLNQTAVLSGINLPTGATFNASTGVLTWVIGYEQAGIHSLTVRATDGFVNTDTTAVVTVSNVNRAPVFATVLTADSIKSDSSLSFTYTATDQDTGTTLTFMSGTITPAFAGTWSVDSTGVLSFAPAFADAGKTFSVTAKVTDGIDTTTSAAGTITVTYQVKKGDVSGNGTLGSDDASLVLQEVVGLVGPYTPGTPTFYAADVNGDGQVGALDASWILFAVVNDTFPNGTMPKAGAVAGDVQFGKIQASENSDVVNVPLVISNSNNVLSSYVELNIDKNYADVENVASNLPEGWIMLHNYVDGKLKIAMSGTTALANGSIVTVSLKLQDKEAKFKINGSALLNDNLNSTLSDFSVKQVPTQFELSQNYPNPFNPSTKIKYQLAADSKVSLTVYDMLGQKVKTLVNNIQEAGYYTITWDGTNEFGHKVTSGVYIYRLETGSYVQTLKMNLLK